MLLCAVKVISSQTTPAELSVMLGMVLSMMVLKAKTLVPAGMPLKITPPKRVVAMVGLPFW